MPAKGSTSWLWTPFSYQGLKTWARFFLVGWHIPITNSYLKCAVSDLPLTFRTSLYTGILTAANDSVIL